MSDYEDGSHVVVDEKELWHKTSTGWRLVQVVVTTEPVEYVSRPSEPPSQANNWQLQPEKRSSALGPVTKYLLAQSHDEELACLRQKIDELSVDLATTARVADDSAASQVSAEKCLVSEKDRYAKSVEVLRRETDLARAAEAARMKECDEARADLAKVKADLKKLTKAFGAIQIKQALGPNYTEAD